MYVEENVYSYLFSENGNAIHNGPFYASVFFWKKRDNGIVSSSSLMFDPLTSSRDQESYLACSICLL